VSWLLHVGGEDLGKGFDAEVEQVGILGQGEGSELLLDWEAVGVDGGA